MALTALLLVIACLTLVACGSSSSTASSSTASSTASTQTGSTSGARSAFAARFKVLRECLQKNGVTLPDRTPGQPGGAGGLLGGGPPPGVSKTTYEAAIKKCGGHAPGATGGGRRNSPAFKQAVARFAACMREHGVNLPTPNTSGTGPVFNTSGLNTAGATFRAAQLRCASVLRGSLPANPAGQG